MRNRLHDVRREVWLDDTLTAETANASLGFIPIRVSPSAIRFIMEWMMRIPSIILSVSHRRTVH